MDCGDVVGGGVDERREKGTVAVYQPPNRLQSAPVEVGRGEIAASKTPDKIKRDEWSEGGVLTLLEVYESKWVLRNRAKLKGNDWEDIARQVSDRSCGSKSLKTPNQCKNKMESMKKRYRAESAAGTSNSVPGSSWQFFARMDSLLKGTNSSQTKGGAALSAGEQDQQALPKVEMENSEHVMRQASDATLPQTTEKAQIGDAVHIEAEGHLQDSNQDDGSNTLSNNKKESRAMDSHISTPRSNVPNTVDRLGKIQPFKRRKSSSSNVGESIRMLAHSILKIEQARMEMYKDTERMRAEAEIRRGEMELKRTEILTKTQLEIAKLLCKRPYGCNNKSGSSSLGSEPTISAAGPKSADGRTGQLWPLLFLFGS